MQTDEAPRLYPTFRFTNAAQMIDWLEKAFGFRLHAKHMDGDTIAHAELSLGSSMIMCGQDRADAYGKMVGQSSGQGGKSIYVAIDDADAMHDRAKAAGAKILEAPTDRDYGSREFICADPEGNVWAFGTYWPKAGDKNP